jgi:uncharacterized protein (TIGR03435 family)
MIKNLLADRFHMSIHREMKDVTGYALVIGKDGPKISGGTDAGSLGIATRLQRKPDGTVAQQFHF